LEGAAVSGRLHVDKLEA